MIPRSRQIQAPQDTQQEEVAIGEGRINGGMITELDPADIPNGALQLAKNAVIRADVTTRRPGSYALTPDKPNSSPVIKIAFLKSKNNNTYTLRFTPSTIHIRGESSWTPIVITPALTGGLLDRFTTANILDKFVFANNGADVLQTIDFDSNTCAPLTDDDVSMKYRYVFGFFNREVGLELKNENEVQVGWSADGDATIWDSTVDQSAGSSPILESPDDLSDFITGGKSFSNVAIMMREKSTWLITKQPIPQNPFYFQSAIPGIGMDCSFSLQIVSNGIAWVGTRTREVWAYTPGSAPERLSFSNKTAIFNDIKNAIPDFRSVFGSFDSKNSEYSIHIPSLGNVTKTWTYNFEYQKWVYSELYDVTTAENTEIATHLITIDDLVGTIDSLGDTHIDDLSPSSSISVPFSYGRGDGSIAVSDEVSDKDAPHTSFPTGIEFNTELESKVFVIPKDVLCVNALNIEYKCTRSAILNLSFSKDEGLHWIALKSVTVSQFNRRIILALRKQIRARRFIWKLTWNRGDVQITNFELFGTHSGDSTQGE